MIKYTTFVLIVLFTCCLSFNPAYAMTFDFEKVAESADDDFESLRGSPSINKNGAVVYYDQNTLYLYDGTPHQWFTAIRSVYSSISFYPSINNSETIAFGVFPINGLWATVSTNGASLKNIVDNSLYNYSYISSTAEINDNGYVSGWAKNIANNHLIYLSNGSTEVKIADTSGIYHTLLDHTAINNNNFVVFVAYYTGGSEIVISNGTTSNIIANTDVRFDHFNFGEIDMNDSEEVAFRAALDDGREAVVLGNKDTYRIVADTSSEFESFNNGGFDGVSVNNINEVVFWGKVNGIGGIYLGGEYCKEKVIDVGDTLDENTVTDLFISNAAINDYGQIVFKATLQREDESKYYAIYIANPFERLDESDTDEDGIVNCLDNCPDIVNPSQEDMDNDGIGDGCDDDIDGDGYGNDIDTCPLIENPGQEDTDSDGIGDDCDDDDDNDDILDSEDNCQFLSNSDQNDLDEDGIGDICDGDKDNDGVENESDNCPETENTSQSDYDGDGFGDPCDHDMDGDGYDSVLHGGQDGNDMNENVTPATEGGPNGNDPDYDGNGDGTPDGTQACVQSLDAFDNSGYVTLSSPDGTLLSGVSAEDNPAPGDEDHPSETDFPYGFFSFTVNNVTPGGSTTVMLNLPDGATPTTYYKYGPTALNTAPHWYEFMYDSTTGTGAEISGNTITLHFVDGSRGDDDLDATNGIIVDVGAPGEPATTTSNGGSSGGGGGCFVAEVIK